ncbi:hypothetical protein SAMN04488027_101294 [Psychroflexus sediminis]|uniref:Thioredoxin-like n=2 Tax=Psychroflexus sediminis TaxID=470826 RepID=A0A1G7U6E9_9FLAO|nr:hypothetical protein SAMN04488027_101294 [Psychroflexus sediminis]
MANWLNTKITSETDAFKAYNISAFPKFFILDQDKKIVSKQIGANQLLEVMNSLNR